jgi:hypothetical protein
MTKQKIISFLKNDIKRLEAERKKLKPFARKQPVAYTYIMAREHTLTEILEMFEK